nr:MAG TPA: hypothetical protein [Caudoviricetes sp.]
MPLALAIRIISYSEKYNPPQNWTPQGVKTAIKH